MSTHRSTVAAAALLSALWALGACGGVSSSLEDPFNSPGDRNEFRIFVENNNFYDARIYALASGGVRRQIGTVGGKTDRVFTVPWQFSNDLRVQIDLLAGPTCTTDVIQVDPGDDLRLQILSAISSNDFCR